MSDDVSRPEPGTERSDHFWPFAMFLAAYAVGIVAYTIVITGPERWIPLTAVLSVVMLYESGLAEDFKNEVRMRVA